MAYVIGTDEAGYGPNLGPLVVSASVWRVSSITEEDLDLFAKLRPAVRRSEEDADGRIAIGDSKELYKPGKGLQGLEQGVFPCLDAIGKTPRTWREIWPAVAPKDAETLAELPWYGGFDLPLPISLEREQLDNTTSRFTSHCTQSSCELLRLESRVVFPHVFNRAIEEFGNKASALSHFTLTLIRDQLSCLSSTQPTYVLCDKHGGRNKYGPLLNKTFPDTLALVQHEGRNESAYRMGEGDHQLDITFRAKGEGFLPSALASMISKYLRELAMKAFNEFWSARVDNLKPTAGYPVDAKRFKIDIAHTQKKLGIADRMLWRIR